MEESRCKTSRALLFRPSKDDLQVLEDRRTLKQMQSRLEELEEIILILQKDK